MEGLLVKYFQNVNVHNLKIHLITFEQPQYTISEQDHQRIKKELSSHNIVWYPKKYRTGGVFILFKKLVNLLAAFFQVYKINRRTKLKAIVGFTSLSGSIAFLISQLLSLKLIIICFEPHSEYMIDFKIWTKTSLSYLVLKKMEKLQVLYSDALVVPTKYTVDLVKKWGFNGMIYKMPICIDENDFDFSLDQRTQARNKLGFKDRQVILYLGKFDGIYFGIEEVVRFYSELFKSNNRLFFYVITPSPIAEVRKSFEVNGFSSSDFLVSGPVPYDRLNWHIGACDMGMLAVPSLPSQKFRTPVKTANYLMCGLPYIVSKFVSEDDLIAEEFNVGVVVESIIEVTGDEIQRINRMMAEDRAEIATRCKSVAMEFRSLDKMVSLMNKIFEGI